MEMDHPMEMDPSSSGTSMRMEEKPEYNIRYKRTPGTDASHGHKFEMELSTLVYLRCMRLYRERKVTGFSLLNNVQNIGALDDIVVKVEYFEKNISKTKLIFVQCKHVADPRNSETRFEKYMNDRNQIKKWFESYVRIRKIMTKQHVDESLLQKIKTKHLKNELHNIQRKEIYDLKKVFNCDFSDCEFVFLSNMDPELDQISQTYEFCTTSNDSTDYSSKIVKTTEQDGYEVRLNEYVLKECCSKEFYSDILIKEFCDQFRLFMNQTDRLEFFINKEISLYTRSIRDVDMVREKIVMELYLYFNSSEYCELVTEKHEILRQIKCLVYLKCESAEMIDKYFQSFSTINMFSKEAIDELRIHLNPKDVLDIRTSSTTLEKLKLTQFVMSENKECLLLFLNSEDDLSNWMYARKTYIYRSFSIVYVFSQPFLNHVSLNENDIFLQVTEEDIQINYFAQLSKDVQNMVLHSKVCFQGFTPMKMIQVCKVELLHALDGNTLLRILENEEIKISESLPAQVENCIPRKFQVEKLKEKYRNEFKLYLNQFEPGHTYFMFAENYEQEPAKYFMRFKTMKDVENYISSTKFEKEKTFLFCCMENENLELLYSIGKQGDYTETEIVNENDVLDMPCKFTTISDTAGMRKSNTLLYLANEYKRRISTDWTSYIKLKECLQVLKDDARKSLSAIELISKHVLGLRGIEDEIFTYACNERGNVALFFDAFDEMSEEEHNTIRSLFTELEKTKIKRIFLSSVQNTANILNSHPFGKSITVLPLTNEDRAQFLANDWYEKLKEDPKQKYLSESMMNKMIESLSLAEKYMNSILEIPLEIREFTDIHFESLPKHSEMSLIDPSLKTDLKNAYEWFMMDHIQRVCLENLEVKIRKS